MRQKRIINILIVIVASGLLLLLWFHGFSWVYAQMIKAGANVALIFSKDTHVGLKIMDNAPAFIVETLVEGKKGTYPQKAELILLPFIMILTWQILLFFNLPWKYALRSSVENIVTFYIIQVVYVLLLTSYYNSSTIKFIYNLLLDSFYIIALFLIVKDAFRYELIGVNRNSKDTTQK